MLFTCAGGERPKAQLYIPPAPPEDEESLFATMAAGINFDKYDEISVEATGRDAPKNISAFEECGFSETTLQNIKLCNYTRPTPVQKHAIPIVMAGRDLMACAQTGSGKTVSHEISNGKLPCTSFVVHQRFLVYCRCTVERVK